MPTFKSGQGRLIGNIIKNDGDKIFETIKYRSRDFAHLRMGEFRGSDFEEVTPFA